MTKQLVITTADILTPSGFFSNYTPGITWRLKYMTLADKAASFWAVNFSGTFDDTESAPIAISSFAVALDRYTRRSSADSLRDRGSAFSYDIPEQILYVAYANKDQSWMYPARKEGESLLFANEAQVTELGPVNSVYNDEYADIRLIDGTVNDSLTIDDMADQKWTYADFGFSLINDDGELDSIRPLIINQLSTIRVAEVDEDTTATWEDFEVIRYGLISDVSFSDGSVSVTVTDDRSFLKTTVNPRTLSLTDYPSLEDNLVDKNIPLLLNRATIPAVQVSAETFILSDTYYDDMTAVHAVYVDGVSTSHTVDLAAGTVTISGYTSGDVTADATGLNEPNVVDQIMYLFETFGGIEEDPDFVDVTHVQAMRDKGYTGAYYIGTDGVTLNTALQELATGLNLYIWPKVGGVYGFKDITLETPAIEIDPSELAAFPSRSYEDKDYISSLLTNYGEDYSSDEYKSINNVSLFDEAVLAQSLDVQGEFLTTVTGATDAGALGLARYEQRITVPPIITISLTATIEYDVLDYVIYTHQRVNDAYGEDVKVIIERSRYRVIEASRINRTAVLQWIDYYPFSVNDLPILDFNGGTIYMDFNGTTGSAYISFGEVS